MKHSYKISGMTCNGCRSSVERYLQAVPGAKNISVSLENEAAEIEMENHIPIETLQKALPEKYTITENNQSDISDNGNLQIRNTPEWKGLFPLFLIFGYITIAAYLLNNDPFNGNGFMLDFMGLFYIVFSFFKMLDLRGFSESFRMYDPLAKQLPPYGMVYPFIETILAVMFLFRYNVEIALVATLVILGITTIGVVKVLADKKAITCACLGTALKLPMTKATFIENSVMIIMAILMLSEMF